MSHVLNLADGFFVVCPLFLYPLYFLFSSSQNLKFDWVQVSFLGKNKTVAVYFLSDQMSVCPPSAEAKNYSEGSGDIRLVLALQSSHRGILGESFSLSPKG